MANKKRNIGAILLMVVVLLCGTAQAWELSLGPMYTDYNNSGVKDGFGAKAKLGHSGFYVWASKEFTNRIYQGYEVMKLDITGYGIGGEIEIFNGLFLSTEIGRYNPAMKTEHTLWIGIPWYVIDNAALNKKHISYAIESDYGGSLGLHYHKAIGQKWGIQTGVKYRYLHLNETIYRLDEVAFSFFTIPDNSRQAMSYSGVQLGIAVHYKF